MSASWCIDRWGASPAMEFEKGSYHFVMLSDEHAASINECAARGPSNVRRACSQALTKKYHI